ncbi:MAG: Terminase small subunit [Syntrophorhabdaceae bacterium PtaU1.Bin034]|nr:MAG: Terminase small subunit [Syntrophorhabdaceae bacterium PtaU1.Bin034]
MKARAKLTKRQHLFVLEYLVDYNGTRAAIRAGYSPKTAEQLAYQLLQIPSVKEALDAEVQKRLEKIGVTADRVLTELARIGMHDIRKLYNEDGTLKAPHEWDNDTAAAVAGIEVFEEFEGKGKNRKKIGDTRKVKVFDKKGALELLGKHLKLFSDKVEHEHTGKDGGPIKTEWTNFPPDPKSLEEWEAWYAKTMEHSAKKQEGEST